MSVAADSLKLQHSKLARQRFLLTAAQQVVLDYLESPTRRQGVTFKTLCYNVLPANRNLLLNAIELLAQRGVIQLRPSGGDILVRLAPCGQGGAE